MGKILRWEDIFEKVFVRARKGISWDLATLGVAIDTGIRAPILRRRLMACPKCREKYEQMYGKPMEA